MSDVIGTMSQKLNKKNVLLSTNILTLIQDQKAANGEFLSLSLSVCVCVCVCVCVRERERERERERSTTKATQGDRKGK